MCPFVHDSHYGSTRYPGVVTLTKPVEPFFFVRFAQNWEAKSRASRERLGGGSGPPAARTTDAALGGPTQTRSNPFRARAASVVGCAPEVKRPILELLHGKKNQKILHLILKWVFLS